MQAHQPAQRLFHHLQICPPRHHGHRPILLDVILKQAALEQSRFTPAARQEAIRFALDLGLTVVAEVGKKDPRQQPSAEALAEQALADFEAGAAWVIVEARESGKGVGVYGPDGSVHERDVDIIVTALNSHLERFIWEAPLKNQQEYFILRFGADVSLGNIQPRDVLGLEALRAGLRFETLRPLVEQMEREEALSLAERVSRMAYRKLPEA